MIRILEEIEQEEQPKRARRTIVPCATDEYLYREDCHNCGERLYFGISKGTDVAKAFSGKESK